MADHRAWRNGDWCEYQGYLMRYCGPSESGRHILECESGPWFVKDEDLATATYLPECTGRETKGER